MNGNKMLTQEQRWFEALDGFRVITEEIEAEAAQARQQAEAQVGRLKQALDGVPPAPADLQASVDQVRQRFEAVVARWIRHWQDGELARRLSSSLSDRLVLLVYGKVNAGKSSLLNFMVERAMAHGLDAQRFRIEGGERVDIHGEFATGATETTSSIQGVEIGQRLILLDSPGLHSVTEANQALTERYVAAADGALQLTNSGSPGQQEELDALAKALRESTRPIICVITRSDENEPDEIDGIPVDRFVNKDPDRRRLQEDDVLARGREEALRLGAGEAARERLRPPVSVSALCARLGGNSPQALAEAGFDRLYEKLATLAGEALEYKRRKPLAQALEHRRQLQSLLEKDVMSALDRARAVGQEMLHKLDQQAPRIVDALSARGLRVLFEALQRHQHDRNVKAALAEVQEVLRKALDEEVRPLLEHYRAELGQLLVEIDPEGVGAYEEEFVSIEQIKGSGYQAAGGTAGALGGMAAGAALGSAVPVIGNVLGGIIGGVIGGLLGHAAGSLGVETYVVKELIGVSFDQLRVRAEPRMRSAVTQAVHAVQQRCAEAVGAVAVALAVIEEQLQAFANEQAEPPAHVANGTEG